MKTHGKSKTVEYRAWIDAKRRCHNKEYSAYHLYGARGITMCERWYISFESFLGDMGKRPAGKTLERRDNNGPYSPENCYWATQSEQSKNTRNTHFLTYQGEILCVSDWGRRLGVTPQAITRRLKRKPNDLDYVLSSTQHPKPGRPKKKPC